MILGIGTDLCNIERIEKTLERFGDRFRNRVFTDIEQAKGRTPQRHARHLCQTLGRERGLFQRRWAPGFGWGSPGRTWRSSNLRTGQPVMHVTGWAAERLAEMTPPGYEAIIHVTLTDDHPWAQAFVVIEARPLASLDIRRPTRGGFLTRPATHQKAARQRLDE